MTQAGANQETALGLSDTRILYRRQSVSKEMMRSKGKAKKKLKTDGPEEENPLKSTESQF